ncbi:phospholipase A and acyltransferase 3-like [Carassius carassius]|uniref:phospholipase A and acyltransferase 3-like n=1 Tax=Carassius carassius TaxID=217509 RepID=UPI00286888B0|nr:phospholipase A and acyltransferase 3-like [Carassius carassius]
MATNPAPLYKVTASPEPLKRMVSRIKKLNPGDLIKIHRGGYHHLALYIGEGYVIHLAPSSEYADAGVSGLKSIAQSIATVKKEKLQDVVGKDVYHIYNVLDNQSTPLPTPDIIQKAQSLVGTVLPYNLATRNCEHFVTELRYGTPKSQQVQLSGMTFYIRIILYS